MKNYYKAKELLTWRFNNIFIWEIKIIIEYFSNKLLWLKKTEILTLLVIEKIAVSRFIKARKIWVSVLNFIKLNDQYYGYKLIIPTNKNLWI